MKQLSIAEKAEVLSQALPYIQKYNGKTIVISYDNSVVKTNQAKDAFMRDIVLLSQIGVKIVLVHGDFDGKSELLQIFIDNKAIVSSLEKFGAKSTGISGVDGHLLDIKASGEIDKIDTKIIMDLLDANFVPVIYAVASDNNGNLCNLNADVVASRIAGEMHATSLIALTNTLGILQNENDDNSLIPSFNVSKTAELIKDGIIKGNMIGKVVNYVEAIRRGVKKVFIIDGGLPHSILIETLSDEGIGTMIF